MAFNKAKVLHEAENLVIQGKISQAIKRYFDILDKDPSEIILLNTIGDLYIRDKNVSEGLKQFYRLAEAYLRDGFTLKAIAIYKKVVKLEPDSVDPLLKLAELYQTQRLVREAREVYYQVVDCYKKSKKRKQNDKALETLHTVVQLDVENPTARARLAAFCEEIGHKDEALQVYLETAQLAHRRGDTEVAQIALEKAQELDPNDPQIQLLRARTALALKHPEEVETILSATPGLKDDPAGRSLLIDSYFAMQQPEKAEALVLGLFRATPGDFSPLASFLSVCVNGGQLDAASKALSAVADELIEQGNTSSLMESLRLIWSKYPQHLPALELILRICDESGDKDELAEILGALGHAYMQCGQFEKAEQSFQRLVSHEPGNEHYRALLKEVLQKQGKEFRTADVTRPGSAATALAQEKSVAAPAASALRAVDREAIVKEALENSELLARYHLVSKAVAELERILEIYPDETEIHRRLVGMCWKDMPERAEQAAQALARIYAQRGDAEGARRFAQMAGGRAAAPAVAVSPPLVGVPAVSPKPLPPLPAQPAATAAGDNGLASEISVAPMQGPGTAPAPHVSSAAPAVDSLATTPAGISLDLSIPLARHAPPAASVELPLDFETLPPSALPASSSDIQEIDLSEDWESFLAQPAAPLPAPEGPPEAASFSYDDSRIEVTFYLDNGFFEEAIQAVGELEKTLPGDPRVAELRALVEARTSALEEEAPEKQPVERLKPTPLEAVAPPAEEAVERRELVSSFAAPEPEAQPAAAPTIPPREEEIPTEPAPAMSVEAPANLFGDLAEAFESARAGLEAPIPLPEPPSPPTQEPAPSRQEEIPTEPAPAVSVEAPANLFGDRAEAFEPASVGSEAPTPLPGPPSPPTEEPAPSREEEIPTEPTPAVSVEAPADLLGELAEAFEPARVGSEESAPLPVPPSAPTEEPAPSRKEEIPTEPAPAVSVEAPANLLGELAEAFESARAGLEAPTPLPEPPSPPTQEPAAGFAASASAAVSPQRGPLDEMFEAPATEPVEDDPETHYYLGVAFWEMNLLDEAIGEFQKVVRGEGKRPHPPNYLQACTMLATCFMDKGMAPIAVKWYGRALETPDLDEEAWLALQYDLGVAYEQAGDLPHALERFSEVYGQNIDFRDVAEKIRTLQQKGS